MKSLQESLLDDEEGLLDNTDFINIIKKIDNLEKPYIPSYTYAHKNYDVWFVWLKILDCIYGNLKSIPEIQVRICIYALANWMPDTYILNPDSTYFQYCNVDKFSIKHLSKGEYNNLKKRLINIALSEKPIDVVDIENVINDVFSEEFIEMFGDESLMNTAKKYLILINNKLIEASGFNYIQFMKKNHLY